MLRQRNVPFGRDQLGFTLVEVMVAALVLMVGILGTFVMIDGAQRTTRENNARTAATALAREILEQSRTVEYEQVSSGALLTALRAKPELGGTVTNGVWRLRRKGIDYAVTSTICTFDDPLDGLGNPGPQSPCPAGSTEGRPLNTTDSNPDDFRRVTLTLQWTRGTRTQQITQTSQINNPGGGIGPRIVSFPSPFGGAQITSGTSVPLTATSTSAHLLSWSADDGRPAGRGTLQGPSTSWSWSWPIGTVDSGTPRTNWVVDGAYTVNVQPFDSRGVPGELRVASVLLNRRVPLPVTGMRGGRSGGGSGSSNLAEMDWQPSPERDVIGYRVRRIAPTVANICPATSTGVITALECTESNPPSGVPLTYEVVAVDRADLANPLSPTRDGTAGAPSQRVTTSDHTSSTTRMERPIVTVSTVNGKPQLNIAPPADSNGGASVLFYRVYRDGVRYARTPGNGATWLDQEPKLGSTEYRVSAVHNPSYNEGKLSDPVIFNG